MQASSARSSCSYEPEKAADLVSVGQHVFARCSHAIHDFEVRLRPGELKGEESGSGHRRGSLAYTRPGFKVWTRPSSSVPASRLRSSRGHQLKGSDSEYGKDPESGDKQDRQGDERRRRRRHTQVSRVRQDLHPRSFLGRPSQPRPRSGRCLDSRSAHSRTSRPPQRRRHDPPRRNHGDNARA